MKIRFKHWKWKEIPWIALGVALLFLLIWITNDHTDWTNYIPVTW